MIGSLLRRRKSINENPCRGRAAISNPTRVIYFMAKDPAFLFYSSDFLSGVTDLTMEERGQYITLLCLQHQKGELNEKTIRLTVGSVSVDVLAKFQKSGDCYKNLRLETEILKRLEFTESRRLNGQKGGRPKASAKPLAKPSGKPKKNLLENENEDVIGVIDIGDTTEEKFIIINPKYVHQKKYRLYGLSGVTQFLEQEGGGWPRTDYCEKWIREFNRDEFEGRAHIIRSYNKYINSQFK
jgi:uncharacterized protein YdaU (DUF1376 family)